MDIVDHPHLITLPFTIQLTLPPLPSCLGCEVYTDTYHNLPYIGKLLAGTQLASPFLLHGHYNSSYWFLSINSKEFITAEAVVEYVRLLQHPINTMYIPCILARRIASNHTNLGGSRAIFNQMCLISEPLLSLYLP